MVDAINALLSVLLTVLGAATLTETGAAAGMMTAVAVAVVATAVVAILLLAATGPTGRSWSLARPRRTIDVSTLLAQSDPDAAGHPRPRAPGIAASAA